MYIDSFSLTWYVVAAESKTVKQSARQGGKDSEFCKCVHTCEDLSGDRCSCMRVEKCRLVSPM